METTSLMKFLNSSHEEYMAIIHSVNRDGDMSGRMNILEEKILEFSFKFPDELKRELELVRTVPPMSVRLEILKYACSWWGVGQSKFFYADRFHACHNLLFSTFKNVQAELLEYYSSPTKG